MIEAEVIEMEPGPQDEPMTPSELVQAVEREFGYALGDVDDEATANRALAMDYFYGHRPRRPSDTTKSGVVSMDVADAVDSTVAAIMPAFSQDMVASFEPEGPDDVDQAAEESDYVNYVLMNQHDGFMILQKALIDALLQRNCQIKVYTDQKTDVSYETHENIPAMGLQQLLQQRPGESVEVLSHNVTVQPQMTPQGPVNVELYSVELRRYKENNQLRIDPMAPEEFLINGDHQDNDLQTARFVAHRRGVSVSNLIAEGYDPDIVNKLEDFNLQVNEMYLSRNRDSKEEWFNTGDPSTQLKDVYEIYYRIDYDGDGIAELRRIVYSSGQILDNKPYDVVEIASGTGYVVPHRWMGRSLFDKQRDIQDTKTELTRQIVDAGRLNINQRLWAVEKDLTNPDDLYTSRTGGVVGVNKPNSIGALPQTQLPPETWTLMEYMDKMRRERGGGAIDSGHQAQQVAGDTAHGIERTVSLMEQMNANVAECFSETLIRQLFMLIHWQLRTYHRAPVQYQTQGQWKTVEPGKWRNRSKVAVTVGLSHGERAQRTQSLGAMFQVQEKAMQTGMPVTDIQRMYNTLVDGARAGGLDNPERYLIDPKSPEGQQLAQKNAQRAQQQQAQQQQMMAQQQKLQESAVALEAQKNQVRAMEAENKRLKNQMDTVQNGIDQGWDREKFYRELTFDYDKLEAEQDVNIPGKGTSR